MGRLEVKICQQGEEIPPLEVLLWMAYIKVAVYAKYKGKDY